MSRVHTLVYAPCRNLDHSSMTGVEAAANVRYCRMLPHQVQPLLSPISHSTRLLCICQPGPTIKHWDGAAHNHNFRVKAYQATHPDTQSHLTLPAPLATSTAPHTLRHILRSRLLASCLHSCWCQQRLDQQAAATNQPLVVLRQLPAPQHLLLTAGRPEPQAPPEPVLSSIGGQQVDVGLLGLVVGLCAAGTTKQAPPM